MKKKLIITTYFFPPENTPRAFRAFELSKYFSSQGLEVEIFTPETDYDYGFFEKKYGFKVNLVKRGLFINKFVTSIKKNESNKSESKFSFLKKLGSYFIGNKDIEYSYTLYKTLKENVKSYDYILSIALPFSVTLGTALFISYKKPEKLGIAEYGDPYYYSPYFNKFVIHKYMEKWALSKFNFVTITTDKILKYFLPYKKEEHIKVIPQGFDFAEVSTATYLKNSVPTFAYAGIFYEKERDPTDFLNYLISLDDYEYKFNIYTDLKGNNGNGYKLVEPFIEKLNGKLILHDLIPRDQCIYELSKMDFLINIETNNASPSKIIDYKLTTRPTLEIDKKKNYQKFFKEFLNGDFKNDSLRELDMDRFDINNVGKKFLELLGVRN